MNQQNRYEFRYELVKFALRYGKKPAAREYGTSATVVRKWVARYKSEGITGLKERSRKPHVSPNKCSERFEKKVIKIRQQTRHKFGAVRLIERFDLKCGKSCIQRIINEHGLKKKKKTKKQTRNELWSIKKLMKTFDKIQIDVKELTDIPLYLSCVRLGSLPKYEFTARCVKTGAAFICYAHANNSINAATFAMYVLSHLKKEGFDLSAVQIQTDNGAEFNACGQKRNGDTPFETAVKTLMHVKLAFIPPASPTFNSDVETFHRLVEDEFYDIEPILNMTELIRKSYTYLIEFNYIRKNSYKDHKTPIQLATEDNSSFNLQLFNLQPVLLEDYQHIFLDPLNAVVPDVTRLTGKPDPFILDPKMKETYDPLGLMDACLGNSIRGEGCIRSSHE
jgi:transposase